MTEGRIVRAASVIGFRWHPLCTEPKVCRLRQRHVIHLLFYSANVYASHLLRPSARTLIHSIIFLSRSLYRKTCLANLYRKESKGTTDIVWKCRVERTRIGERSENRFCLLQRLRDRPTQNRSFLWFCFHKLTWHFEVLKKYMVWNQWCNKRLAKKLRRHRKIKVQLA